MVSRTLSTTPTRRCRGVKSGHVRAGGRAGRRGRSGGVLSSAVEVSSRRTRSRVQRVKSSQGDEARETVTSPSTVKKEVVCACGRCDGSGRIIGGIGAVPGFRWWPIKAYRPCPGLIESGRGYERCGDETEERTTPLSLSLCERRFSHAHAYLPFIRLVSTSSVLTNTHEAVIATSISVRVLLMD